jgi:hypothetical protein
MELLRMSFVMPLGSAKKQARRPMRGGFNQLHNSLNGGSAGHGGIEDVPAPLVDAEPFVDAAPLRPP